MKFAFSCINIILCLNVHLKNTFKICTLQVHIQHKVHFFFTRVKTSEIAFMRDRLSHGHYELSLHGKELHEDTSKILFLCFTEKNNSIQVWNGMTVSK